MKKDAYEDLVKEISKKLSEKILQEAGANRFEASLRTEGQLSKFQDNWPE